MRTVYLGTSEFAAIVLEALASSAHRPALVISRPDRPRGRGRRTPRAKARPPRRYQAGRRRGIIEIDDMALGGIVAMH